MALVEKTHPALRLRQKACRHIVEIKPTDRKTLLIKYLSFQSVKETIECAELVHITSMWQPEGQCIYFGFHQYFNENERKDMHAEYEAGLHDYNFLEV